MEGNVIQFPTEKVTVDDMLEAITAAVRAGEVRHLMFVTMGHKTEVNVGMTTMPAFEAIYMNQYQRMRIEGLMRDNGMLP